MRFERFVVDIRRDPILSRLIESHALLSLPTVHLVGEQPVLTFVAVACDNDMSVTPLCRFSLTYPDRALTFYERLDAPAFPAWVLDVYTMREIIGALDALLNDITATAAEDYNLMLVGAIEPELISILKDRTASGS